MKISDGQQAISEKDEEVETSDDGEIIASNHHDDDDGNDIDIDLHDDLQLQKFVLSVQKILSEVRGKARKQACMAAWGLVLNGEVGQAGFNGLDSLLGSKDEEVVIAVLQGLCDNIEGSEEKKCAFVELFGVGQLVRLLGQGCGAVQAKACKVISMLTRTCAPAQDLLREVGAVERLVGLLSSGGAHVQKWTLRAILNMSLLQPRSNNVTIPYVLTQDAFCDAGVAFAIYKLLKSSEIKLQRTALEVMCALCHSNVNNQDAFRGAGFVPLLVGLLSSSSSEVQRRSSEAMLEMSRDHFVNVKALCDECAIPALVEVAERKNGSVRQQACLTAWELALQAKNNSVGLDTLKGLLREQNAELVQAALEGLTTCVQGNKLRAKMIIRMFGVVWIVKLMVLGSVSVQANVLRMICALTLEPFNCSIFKKFGIFKLVCDLDSDSFPLKHEVMKAFTASISDYRDMQGKVSGQVAKSAPSFNQGTQWMDHNGCVFPKNVDFSRQCPKGHTLTRLSSKDDHGLPLMCRLCHVKGYRDQSNWMVCRDYTNHDSSSFEFRFACICCGRYAVCPGCSQRSVSASLSESSENISTLVRDYKICFCLKILTHLLQGIGLPYLKQMRSVVDKVFLPKNVTTSQFVQMYVRPRTSRCRNSVVDELAACVETAHHVGQATWFVSHVWTNSFMDTLDAILLFFEDRADASTAKLWIDIFVTPQNISLGPSAPLSPSWYMNTFRSSIAQIGSLLLVVDSVDNPTPLQRAW
jgi:hypothetical protein